MCIKDTKEEFGRRDCVQLHLLDITDDWDSRPADQQAGLLEGIDKLVVRKRDASHRTEEGLKLLSRDGVPQAQVVLCVIALENKHDGTYKHKKK